MQESTLATWVVNHSFGIIKTEKSASNFLIVITCLIILTSISVAFSSGGNTVEEIDPALLDTPEAADPSLYE